MNDTFLNIAIILTGSLLMVFILLQKQGGGVSSLFGGGGSEDYTTKRGLQKNLFWGTIILAIIFVGIALIRIILQ